MRQSLNLLDPMAEVISVTGTPVRGVGWYGPTSGLHSVALRVLNFTGRITIEATLATVPGDADWFSVLPDNAAFLQYPTANFVIRQPSAGETSNTGFNFICNAVWVRASVDRSYLLNSTDTPIQLSYYGVVDAILLNY